MITRTQSSPTAQHPTRAHLFAALLVQLRERDDPGAWIHIDSRTSKGWIHDVLFRKAPWLEVASRDASSVFLNLGRRRTEDLPAIPSGWAEEKGMYAVPYAEAERLVAWMCDYFRRLTGADDTKTSGSIQD